jgi:acyl-CoA dehydrogenase
MTEPGTGSDLASIATTAVRDGDGDVINGAKTFISNGIPCDLCVVAAKTGSDPRTPHRGLSCSSSRRARPASRRAGS